MAVDEYYMENLDEFVNDENKVVTFKWLSTNLKVHVNQAKQMLYTFVQQERNKKDNDKLTVTYFVAGTPKTKNGFMGHKCCVVAEEELGAFKSTLSTVTSCHIYSVQKVKLKDSNTLYMADYDSTKENLHSCSSHSAINNPRAKARSTDELAKLGVQQSQPSSDPPKTNGSLSTVTKATDNGSAAVKTEPKGSIASMFSSAGGKKKEDGEKPSAPAKGGKGGKGSKAGGVMSFFSNQTAKPSKPAESKPADSEPVKGEPVKSKEVKSKESKPEPPKEKKTDAKKSRPSKGKKSTRVSDSDEDKPDTKRRRRIRNDLFDSSSSEDEMDILEESPVPSPVPSPVHESSPEPKSPEKKSKPDSDDEPMVVSQTNGGEKRRKRTRKLVPKTSMDSDGFMVTEKVWESDSTDASEKEEEVKKKAPSPAKQSKTQPTKKASPQKKSPAKGPKNQTSLMSFFKKK